jgi:hypothetical protein
MRLLKFFAAFFLTAVVIFGFIFGMNWKSFSTFIDNRDAMAEGSEWVEKTYSLRGLSEFIAENPQNVSIASIVIGSPDSTILFQQDVPRVMGTTSNILILLAYASELEKGTFNSEEMLAWSDISMYQLPEVDASVHRQSYQAAVNRGWVDHESISLGNALKLLAEFNDLALSDYLWWKLDRDIWNRLPGEFDLSDTDMPLPFSGLYLAISPGLQQQTADQIIEKWSSSSAEEWRNHVGNLSKYYVSDPGEREAITNYLEQERLGNSFIEERNALILFPKTTASEMGRLMQNIWTGNIVPEETGNRIKDWLRWPLERQREVRRDFADYGAMFDNRLGILNGVDFGTSSYTGDTTVQAVFFDRLPIAFWFHMSSNHMHQDFQQRLIYDPAMIDRMKRVVQQQDEMVTLDVQ